MSFVLDSSVALAWLLPVDVDTGGTEGTQRQRRPLATFDARLASACKAAGIAVLP